MKKIEISELNKYFEVPESWQELPLIKFVELTTYINQNESATSIDKLVKTISILSSIEEQFLLTLEMSFINQLSSYINFIWTEPAAEPITTFDFNNESWFIDEQLENSTLNQWLSFELIEKQHQNNPIAGLPFILAVLCRKQGEKFNADLINERAELFKNLPCDIALSLRSFFLTRRDLSYKAIQLSSQIQQIEQKLRTITEESKKNTHGFTWLTKFRSRITSKLLDLWMKKLATSSRT